MGPHPSVAAVRGAVRAALADLPDGALLVACSGGADSTALAAATAFVAARAGRPAGMVSVDHRLQEGSSEQAKRTAQLGYELGLDPVLIVAVDVPASPGAGGPENAARLARYGALDAVAAELDGWVLLGHTLDDQAETVLLGLGRGSGPRSIAGMRPQDGRRLRPLLGIDRATTHAACAALGLEVWDDPHNADPRFTRARLRAEVLPLLEDVLGGGVASALARTAVQLREDSRALDEIAAQLAPGPGAALDVATLGGQPRAVRIRVIRAWTRTEGAAALTAVHYADVDRLITDWHGQGPIDLPGGYRVIRTSGRLRIAGQ